MPANKAKRMARVLKVLRSLRQSEEARLGIMERKTRALKSAQSNAIDALNGRYEHGVPQTAGFAKLLADQMRSSATQEQAAEQQAERQRAVLAQRRGHERITEQFVGDLNQAEHRNEEADQLYEVIEIYCGKPAASKQ